MVQFSSIRKGLVNREVVVAFVILVAFYAAANLVIEPFGKPLEPIAELLFTGYWILRTEFLVGGFMTQLFLTWLWFAVYAYLIAIFVGSAFRLYRR